jgi:MFS family permease
MVELCHTAVIPKACYHCDHSTFHWPVIWKPGDSELCTLIFDNPVAATDLFDQGGQLYSSLGYGTYDQLILQCGYISTAFVCSVVGGLLVDRIGRRRLLLTGITGCVASVLVETIIVAKFAKAGTNKSALRTGVAAFYLYEGFYCLSIDICNFVITSELFPNHLRAKGTAIAAASSALTNLVFLQTAPTGFANIGWKFYLVS